MLSAAIAAAEKVGEAASGEGEESWFPEDREEAQVVCTEMLKLSFLKKKKTRFF